MIRTPHANEIQGEVEDVEMQGEGFEYMDIKELDLEGIEQSYSNLDIGYIIFQ